MLDNNEKKLGYFKIDESIVYKMSPDMAYKFYIFPFKISENKVHIISVNELDNTVETYIKFIYKKDIVKLYIWDKQDVYVILSKYYKKKLIDNAMEQFNKEDKENLYFTVQENNKNVDEAPAVKIVSFLIDQGINMNASDIHIEPYEKMVLIRFRIDGILNKYLQLPNSIYNSLSARIKIMANMDISKKFIPLDGKISYTLGKDKYDLRISTLPTLYGEKIVIRILYKNYENVYIEELGFSDSDYKNIKKLICSKGGMILVTGPTGSGKTTTLYSLLNAMDKSKNNIMTIEDPVEYNMCYINQVNVNNKSGLTFAYGLRSLLRQDPDIILIGEIRDNETAEIAIKAALTGHLVLSTLHTKDAASAVTRLMDMKIENYLLADTLLGVVSQRLVRKICNNCKESVLPLEEEKRKLNLNEGEVIYRGRGCNKCNGTGYFSRTVICEVMEINDYRRETIRKTNIYNREKNLKENMKLLKQSAIELVKEGITTYEEVLKYIV
ncbi:GspE/PulE family protein [Haloimpatiens sp. FM7315]|uniref:GspE/PulE family protein n=1 Tax=Haloimpatiens sp. FM7315 TaxID=3298609 RepID=UPI00370CB974